MALVWVLGAWAVRSAVDALGSKVLSDHDQSEIAHNGMVAKTAVKQKISRTLGL